MEFCEIIKTQNIERRAMWQPCAETTLNVGEQFPEDCQQRIKLAEIMLGWLGDCRGLQHNIYGLMKLSSLSQA